MKILMSVGEASGDLHGSNLIKSLKQLTPNIEVSGIGGSRLAALDQTQIATLDDLAVLGFIEVAKNFSKLNHIYQKLVNLMDTDRPDVFIPVDYPGMNLRLAKQAHRRGIPVYYYISPQIWAWGKNRIKKMQQIIDVMIVVFPFEVEIYENAKIPVFFTGHPLLDVVGSNIDNTTFRTKHGLDPNAKIVGLLPGSRMQEIERILPNMIKAAELLSGYTPILAKAPNIPESYYHYFTTSCKLEANTYDLMQHADLLWVCSGTATLEAGLHQTPMVIMYQMPTINWYIARRLVKMPYIGLVNIALGEKVIPELLQHDVNPKMIIQTTQQVIEQKEFTRAQLATLSAKLGTSGVSMRIAQHILECLKHG